MSECPYCHAPSALLVDDSHGYRDGMTLSLERMGTPSIVAVAYFEEGCVGSRSSFGINFCPICGRDLREVDL